MPSILESGLKKIHEDLNALPPDTKGAFVATVNSKGTYTFGIATRLGDGWSLGAGIQGKLDKTIPDAYVGITKTW